MKANRKIITQFVLLFIIGFSMVFEARAQKPEELLTKFIATKRAECREMNAIPTPAEFEKYYNL